MGLSLSNIDPQMIAQMMSDPSVGNVTSAPSAAPAPGPPPAAPTAQQLPATPDIASAGSPSGPAPDSTPLEQPGGVKRLLTGMMHGLAASLLKTSGLETPAQVGQRRFENSIKMAQAQQAATAAADEHMKAQREIANIDQVDAPPEVKKALGMDEDQQLMLPRNQIQQIISRAMAAKGQEAKQAEIERGKALALGYQDNGDGTYTVLDDSKISAPTRAAIDFKNAQVTLAKAKADALMNPDNPVNQMKLKQMQLQFETAQARLSIAQRSLDQRIFNQNRNYNMQAYGTDAQGNPLPGAMTDDQGNVVGKFGQKAVMPTGASQSQAERATVGDATRTRLQSMLQDPDIRNNMGPLMGNIRDYIAGKTNYLPPKLAGFADELNSYAAFKAGLHPVRGLGALEYFDKQIGKLGQTPEQLESKLKADALISKSVQKAGARPLYRGPVSSPARKSNDPLGIR